MPPVSHAPSSPTFSQAGEPLARQPPSSSPASSAFRWISLFRQTYLPKKSGHGHDNVGPIQWGWPPLASTGLTPFWDGHLVQRGVRTVSGPFCFQPFSAPLAPALGSRFS